MLKSQEQCEDPQRFRIGSEQTYQVSEGEIEGLIFWRRLRNNVDEREGAKIINKSTTRKGHRFSKISVWVSPEVENKTSREALV